MTDNPHIKKGYIMYEPSLNNVVPLSQNILEKQGRILRMPKKVIQIIDDIVYDKAQYDRIDNVYEMNSNWLSEEEEDEICCAIIREDWDHASEALGPDNPSFREKMVPSFIGAFKNPTDYFYLHALITDWKQGVCNYLRPIIDDLLAQACQKRLEADAGYCHE